MERGDLIKARGTNTLNPSTNFVRVCHRVTGRFLFEYDPVRRIVIVSDRGHRDVIDLTEYERRQDNGALQDRDRFG